MKWTESQKRAIDIPVSDIIVSAAAGSGKTAVMAERIINRLTGDKFVDIDKILVVTYTNAAASEIKERVMKKIIEKMNDSNNDILQRQLVLIDNSHFCTIHSFCLELIKKYFYKLGIDPQVKTADPVEAEIILEQAISNISNEYLKENDKTFVSLVNSYGNGRINRLEKLVLNIYKFAKTMPDSDEWLDGLADKYVGSNMDICNCIMDYSLMELSFYRDSLIRATDIINDTDCCKEWLSNIEREVSLISNAINCGCDYEKLKCAISKISFDRLPTSKSLTDDKIKSKIKTLRDNAKKNVMLIGDSISCIDTKVTNTYKDKMILCVKKLSEFAKKTGMEFDRLKREANLIDFSDYEHLALKLLKNSDGSPTDIAKEISMQFDEIYIDEYQDCNNIQNTIFKYISGGIYGHHNMFCVGDMKQSIYKFRDANPLNFKEKCDCSEEYDGKTLNNSNKIYLNANFRSRESILRFVNNTFRQLMSNECGELEYTDDEALVYGANYIPVNNDSEYIDIDIISETNDFGDDILSDKTNSYSVRDSEVIHIASKIKRIVDSGYMLYDAKTKVQRRATYSDIAVLFRTPADYVPSIEKIFGDFKIPYTCDVPGEFYGTEEIEFLISLLKIIDNPDDDISIVTVLKNKIFNFDENDLLRIRLALKHAPYYMCLKKYVELNNDLISNKLSDFLHKLDNYHHKSKFQEISELIFYILDDLKFYSYLSTFPDATIRKNNVLALINKAIAFEKESFKGVYRFINYIDIIKQSKKDSDVKLISDKDDLVRVMSIHKSKGLEFPVVFLAGTGKNYNTRDSQGSVLMHKELGIGLDAVYYDEGYKLPTSNKLAIKQKIKYELMSEELRVIYVALTRPTEKLIITGTLPKAASLLTTIRDSLSFQGDKINPYLVMKSKSIMETLLLSAMRSEGFESSDLNDITINSDGIKYNVSTVNMCDITLDLHNEPINNWKSEFDNVTDSYEDMVDYFNYKYPYSKSCNIPGNLSVTEVKKIRNSEMNIDIFGERNLTKPMYFSTSPKISGNILGTLMHLVMEKLDFIAIKSPTDIENQLSELVNRGVISHDEANSVDIKKIYGFVISDVGKRIKLHYNTFRRELSFKYMDNAKDVLGESTDDKIVIQGTIDAYFEEDDSSIVIIDFKTDKVRNGDSTSIAERYRIQLECYAKAVENITQKQVKEKIIYLFDSGETISL